MARAGELLDLGDRVGARRIVRGCSTGPPRSCSPSWPPATDLGWARRTGPRRCAGPVGCSPGVAAPSARVAGLAARAPGDTRSGRPATRRGRDGGGEVSSYLATRGGVDDAAERGERPDGYPIDYDRAALAAPAGGGVHGLPPGAHPGRRRPRRRGVRGLPRRRARPSPDRWCGARPSWPRRCAADRGPAASCGGCGTPPTPPTGRPSPPGSPPTTPASPRPRATADPRLPSPRPGHRDGDRAAPRGGAAGGVAARSPTAHSPCAGELAPPLRRACPSSPAHRSRPAAAIL